METVMGFKDNGAQGLHKSTRQHAADRTLDADSSPMRALTKQERAAVMHQSVPRERDPNAKYMYTTDQPQGVAIDEIIRRSRTRPLERSTRL